MSAAAPAPACPPVAVDQCLAPAHHGVSTGAPALSRTTTFRVDGGHCVQKLLLVLGQRHIGAVKALALPQLIEAEAEQDGVGLLCEGDGLLLLFGVCGP